MGLKRFILRNMSPTVHLSAAVSNIVKEHSFTKGLKRTVREDFTEDNPLTKAVYDVGKYDGEKDGYVRASIEYEKKLLEQAETFIKEKKVAEDERAAYANLLNEYEAEIQRLTVLNNRTAVENDILQLLLLQERNLKKLE